MLWAASLWIDRGTWRPLGDSTSAFLDLAIRRCRSALAGVRFGMVVYPVQLLSVIGWRIYAAPVEPMALVRSWPIVILGWVGVPVVFALAVWYSRRKRAELERLIQLRMQVQRD